MAIETHQEFLVLETIAIGEELDGLVAGTSATELHKHAAANLWVNLAAPINGWTIVSQPAYMIDTFGLIRLRGAVNGGAATAKVEPTITE